MVRIDKVKGEKNTKIAESDETPLESFLILKKSNVYFAKNPISSKHFGRRPP